MRIARITTGFNEIPGHVSLAIFLTGCTIRCPGCHNPQLQDYNASHKPYSPEELADYVAGRTGLVDSLVWMGGEPTDHPDILEGMQAVRNRLPMLTQGLYTGRSIDDARVTRLMPYLDLAVTEPFRGLKINDTNTNQQIWHKRSGSWSQITYSTFSAGKDI